MRWRVYACGRPADGAQAAAAKRFHVAARRIRTARAAEFSGKSGRGILAPSPRAHWPPPRSDRFSICHGARPPAAADCPLAVAPPPICESAGHPPPHHHLRESAAGCKLKEIGTRARRCAAAGPLRPSGRVDRCAATSGPAAPARTLITLSSGSLGPAHELCQTNLEFLLPLLLALFNGSNRIAVRGEG